MLPAGRVSGRPFSTGGTTAGDFREYNRDMRLFFIATLATLAAMLPLDLIWLTTVAKTFYARHLGHLFAEAPNLTPAGIFYLLYAAGLALLVVVPAATGGFSLGKTYLYGAALGLVAYGTYDLTNHATMRDWPLVVTVVDMAWGALITGLAAVVATVITKYFA